MISPYPLRELGEVSVNHDARRVPVKAADRKPRPYPYYGAQGIVDYVDDFIFDGVFLLVAEDGENLRSRNEDIAFMPSGQFWVNNHAHILRADSDAATLYLKYAINSSDISGYITGSTIPKLSQRSLRSILVPCPPPAVQVEIVSLLGTLDDKIDLNRRMNETLEAMARAIFKDWFVDFGPTRTKAEGRAPYLAPELWDMFPDSFDDEGMPLGWQTSVLGDRVEIYDSKRIPLSSRERKQRQGPYPYHGATGVMDHIDGFLFEGVHVLLGEDGSVVRPDGNPFTQYVWGQFWVNNHAHVLKGRDISNEMLLCFLQQTNVTPYVTGAVQPKLNQKNLKAIVFPSTDPNTVVAFETVVSPLFERIRLNVDLTRTLSKTRDLLLPRLMSGEIRLSEAEQATEVVA